MPHPGCFASNPGSENIDLLRFVSSRIDLTCCGGAERVFSMMSARHGGIHVISRTKWDAEIEFVVVSD